uniref:Uncharacterized protein n=1 Tax=Romanomermis culicivorax TaxID=13658 RepID=A0A915JSP0_ROMCU
MYIQDRCPTFQNVRPILNVTTIGNRVNFVVYCRKEVVGQTLVAIATAFLEIVSSNSTTRNLCGLIAYPKMHGNVH